MVEENEERRLYFGEVQDGIWTYNARENNEDEIGELVTEFNDQGEGRLYLTVGESGVSVFVNSANQLPEILYDEYTWDIGEPITGSVGLMTRSNATSFGDLAVGPFLENSSFLSPPVVPNSGVSPNFRNWFGIWDDFDGPKAIGGFASPLQVDTEAVIAYTPDGSGGVERHYLESQPGQFGLGIITDHAFNLGEIGLQLSSDVPSRSGTVYNAVRQQLIQPAFGNLGAAFDLQLLVENVNCPANATGEASCNGYASSFATAFADFVLQESSIELESNEAVVDGFDPTFAYAMPKPVANGENQFDVRFIGNGIENDVYALQFRDSLAGNTLLAEIPVSIGAAYEYRMRAADPDDDRPLDFRILSQPEHGWTRQADSDPSDNLRNDLIRFSPSTDPAHRFGVFKFSVEVSDGHGGRDVQTWNVNVQEFPDSGVDPVIGQNPPAGSPPIEVAVGSTLSYQFQATNGNASPANSTGLQYSLLGNDNPDGLRIDRHSGVITWTPERHQYQGGNPQTVRVRVTNGQNFADGTMEVSVTNPIVQNEWPEFVTPLANPSISPEGFVDFVVEATDGNNDLLTFSTSGVGDHLVDTQGNTGIIRWDLSQEAIFHLRTFHLTVSASDGRGGSATKVFTVEGYRPNVPPVFTTDPSQEIVAEVGRDFETSVRVVDPYHPAQDDDNALLPYPLPVVFEEGPAYHNGNPVMNWDELGFYLEANPADGNSAIITGNPNASGEVRLGIKATDSGEKPEDGEFTFEGAETIEYYTLNVVAGGTLGNSEPELRSFPPEEFSWAQGLHYRIETYDAENDPVEIVDNFQISFPGAEFVPETSVLTYYPGALTSDVIDGIQVQLLSTDESGMETTTFVPIPDITVTGSGAQARGPRILDRELPDAVLGRTYREQFIATDPENDPLTWSIEEQSAYGMAIDPLTGEFVWKPSIADLGVQTANIIATDIAGLSFTYPIAVTVQAANLPPFVQGFNPPARIGVGQNIDYPLDVIDFDAGPSNLDISLDCGGCGWLSLSPDGESLVFAPTSNDVGSYDYALSISDGEFDFDVSFSGEVTSDAPTTNYVFENSPPTLVLAGQPSFLFHEPLVRGGTQTPILADDSMHPGLNLLDGRLTWDTTGLVPGQTYEIELYVDDGMGGSRTTQRTQVLAVDPSTRPATPQTPPTIQGAPFNTFEVTPGSDFNFRIRGVDAEGDQIFFDLINAPAWLSIDRLGNIRGTLPLNVVANEQFDFDVQVADQFGAKSSPQAISLLVQDFATPTVSATAARHTHAGISPFTGTQLQAFENDIIELVAVTIDERRLTSLEFRIVQPDGYEFIRSETVNGVITHPFRDPGVYTVRAVATYEGHEGEVESDPVEIIVNESSLFEPLINIVQEGETDVLTPIDATITIQYDATFEDTAFGTSWTFDLISEQDGTVYHLDSGRGDAMNAEGDPLEFELIPTFYPEGNYQFSFKTSTFVISGTHEYEKTINVRIENAALTFDAAAPVGNFGISFTDLTVPVGGIPISIVREYDTAQIGQANDFGPGWDVAIRQADVREYELGQFDTQFDPGDEGSEFSFVQKQTLVRIGLPGRESEVFLFDFEPLSSIGQVLFRPVFIPRPGTTSTLTVEAHPSFPIPNASTNLAISNIHQGLVSAADPLIPYHPRNLKQHFVLTTADGFEYRIDSLTGLIDRIDDRVGNYLDLTDDQYVTAYSRTESNEIERVAEVTLVRENGVIQEIIDPNDKRIVYDYDPATGDLIGVTNRENEQVEYQYNVRTGPDGLDELFLPGTPHLLTRIIDSRGVTVLQTDYEEDTARLKQITDADGNGADFNYAFDVFVDADGDGQDEEYSAERITGPDGNPQTIIRDQRGNVVRTVSVIRGDDDRTTADDNYQLTVYSYDGFDFPTGQSKPLVTGIAPTSDFRADMESLIGIPVIEPDGETNLDLWLTRNEYDLFGNLVYQYGGGVGTSYSNHDLRGTPRTIVDPSGTVTRNELYYGSRAGFVQGTLDAVTVTDAAGEKLSRTEFHYETFTGRLFNTFAQRDDGSLTSQSFIGYDTHFENRGLVTRTSSPGANGESKSTFYEYDENGLQFISYTHWEGLNDDGSRIFKTIATWTDYDDENRVVGTAQYVMDGEQDPRSYDELVANGVLQSSTSTVYNELGQVESSTDRFENTTTTIYDVTGNVIETRVPVNSDIAASGVPEGDYLMVTRTAYDENGRTFASSDPVLMTNTNPPAPVNTSLPGEPNDWRVSYSIYDDLGRVIETRRVKNIPITFDTEIADSGAEIFNTAFEPDDPSGVVVSSSATFYDDDGLVQATVATTFGSTPSDNEVLPTVFVYDDAQRQTHTLQFVDLDQDGTFPKDLEGYEETDGVPIIPSWFESFMDLDLETQLAQWGCWTSSNICENDDAIVTMTVFDNAGRQEFSVAPGGERTNNVYDGLGRVKESFSIDPNSPANEAQAKIATSSTYDQRGRRVAATDPMGLQTVYGYTDSGALESVTLPGADSSYHYQYDVDGNQVSIKDPNNHLTTFSYDHFGRQRSRTLPEGMTETMVYDDSRPTSNLSESVGFGQLSYQVDFNGRVTAYRYNNLPTGGGRLVEKFYYDFITDYTADAQDSILSNAQESVSYEYDAFGRVVRELFNDRETISIFDADGRLAQRSTPEGVIGYSYDAIGRMTKSTSLRGGNQTTYVYDTLGRIIDVGAGSAGSAPSEITQYFYNETGSMDRTIQPNDITVSYGYDDVSRLTSIEHSHTSNGVVARFDYELRADGKRTEETRTFGNSTADVATTSWAYDDLGRLVGEARLDGGDSYLTQFDYDAVGNRDRQTTATGSITVLEVNEFLSSFAAETASYDFDSLAALADIKVEDYTYDDNDRLLRSQSETTFADGSDNELRTTIYKYGLDDTSTELTKETTYQGHDTSPSSSNKLSDKTYTYNLQGRRDSSSVRAEVADLHPDKYEYTYNANGVRVAAKLTKDFGSANETVTNTMYHVDENNPTGYAQVREEGVSNDDDFLSNDEIDRSYVFGHDVISQNDTENGPAFFVYDGHGSTRALLNELGVVLEGDDSVRQEFDYTAYGEPVGIWTPETAMTSLLYSGEFTDAATGHQYLRARFYDPSNGRFNRLDPYAGSASDPLTFHKYVYAHNDPITNIDPTGLFSLVGSISVSGLQGNLAGLQGELGGIAIDAADSVVSGFNLRQTSTILLTSIFGGFAIGAIFDLGGVAARTITNQIANFVEESGQALFSLVRRRQATYFYGQLDNLGRSTGARALLTPDLVRNAGRSPAAANVVGAGGGLSRGHLIGSQLGGTGRIPNNLAPQYQINVNNSAMLQIENQVKRRVLSGETIDYSVIPIYRGSDPVPLGFTVRARSNQGWVLEESVRNVPRLGPQPRTDFGYTLP